MFNHLTFPLLSCPLRSVPCLTFPIHSVNLSEANWVATLCYAFPSATLRSIPVPSEPFPAYNLSGSNWVTALCYPLPSSPSPSAACLSCPCLSDLEQIGPALSFAFHSVPIPSLPIRTFNFLRSNWLFAFLCSPLQSGPFPDIPVLAPPLIFQEQTGAALSFAFPSRPLTLHSPPCRSSLGPNWVTALCFPILCLPCPSIPFPSVPSHSANSRGVNWNIPLLCAPFQSLPVLSKPSLSLPLRF